MPNYKEENNHFDYDKGADLSGVIIYGFLGDFIPKKDKDRLFKDINKITMITAMEPEDVVAVYGEKYEDLATGIYLNNEDHTVRSEGAYHERMGSSFNQYYENIWNPEFEAYRKSMGELHELMVKYADKIKFPNDKAREYFDALTVMVGDINNGGWKKRVEADPMYEYAYNMQVKMTLTTAKPSINKGKFEPAYVRYDDLKALDAFGKVGITEAISGAIRASKKMEEHLTTGSVTREELIIEYGQQIERMKKAMSLSKEDYDALKEAGLTQNSYDEYTDGPRGYVALMHNLEARVQLLSAGWPAADLNAVTRVYDVMESAKRQEMKLSKDYDSAKAEYDQEKAAYEAMKADTAEEKDAKTKKRNELLNKSAKLDKLEENKNKFKNCYESLKEEWDRAIDGPMNDLERSTLLFNFTAVLNGAKDKVSGIGASFALKTVKERAAEKLTAAEKATLSVGGIDELVKCIEDVDPSLVSSSKQFGDFKKALKQLAKIEKEYSKNADDPDKKEAYEEKVQETAKLAAKYLKYKRYQAEGPDGKKHKRSDLEARRIKTVDAVLNNLKSIVKVGTDEHIIDNTDMEYGVFTVKQDRLLKDYVTSEPKNDYDKYLARYTGKGVINGTREEMLDALSKAVGCYVWRQKKPKVVFNEEKIKSVAAEARAQLRLDEMSDAEIRQAVVGTKDVINAINIQREKNYGITDKRYYEDYVSNMRSLYQNMPEPTEKSRPAYRKLFENVKKAAHLPAKSAGYDTEKLYKTVAGLNQIICIAATEKIKVSGKRFGSDSAFSAIALDTVAKYNEAALGYVKEARIAVNRAKGVKEYNEGVFDITDPDYVDFENYDIKHVKRQVRKYQDGENLRGLDNELLKATDASMNIKDIKGNIKNVRENVAKQGKAIEAENAAKKPKAKEQTVKGKKTIPESRPRRNSIG